MKANYGLKAVEMSIQTEMKHILNVQNGCFKAACQSLSKIESTLVTWTSKRLLCDGSSWLNELKLQHKDINLMVSISHVNVVISAKLAVEERR